MDDTTKRFSVEAKIENLDEVLAFVDGILEFFDAAAQSAHQFRDFLASEEQDDYQYDYDDLPVTDCTRDKHGFFF